MARLVVWVMRSAIHRSAMSDKPAVLEAAADIGVRAREPDLLDDLPLG